MRKEILAAALSAVLGLTVCGCGQSAAQSAEKTPPEIHAIPYAQSLTTRNDGLGADDADAAVSHPDGKYYVVNDFYNMESGGSLHILPHFETYQQTTEHTCGCASALMVLNWFNGAELPDETEIGEAVRVDTSRGTSVEGLADYFRGLGWQVEAQASAEPRFADEQEWESYLLDKLDRGIPVMVDWVDWSGHWQVAIGLDTCGTDDVQDDVLILADPYDTTDHYQDGYYTYPLSRFFYMWREGPCAEKETPYEQPFVAAWPEEK